jgi:hypothetical protein
MMYYLFSLILSIMYQPARPFFFLGYLRTDSAVHRGQGRKTINRRAPVLPHQRPPHPVDSGLHLRTLFPAHIPLRPLRPVGGYFFLIFFKKNLASTPSRSQTSTCTTSDLFFWLPPLRTHARSLVPRAYVHGRRWRLFFLLKATHTYVTAQV